MATYTHNPIAERRILASLDRFFADLGQGINAYVLRRARMDEIRRLNALSDEQLLAQGIVRDRIPEHVFRDLIGT